MKAKIHPQYFETTVTCACGNRFSVGSTKEDIHTEICSACHPFFTGKQKLVDAAHRVEKYEEKKKKQAELAGHRPHLSKKAKRAARKEEKSAKLKAAKVDARAALKAAKSALSADQ